MRRVCRWDLYTGLCDLIVRLGSCVNLDWFVNRVYMLPCVRDKLIGVDR